MNHILDGMMGRQPKNSDRDRFTCRNIPEAIASELESSDELYFWSEDGTHLISEDGKTSIPPRKEARYSSIQALLDKSSLGLLMSSVNLVLLFWFWFRFGG